MAGDVLSEVLAAIRLTSSVFFDVRASAPWVAEAPPSTRIAQAISPGSQHAIEYHVVTSGSCWISIVDGAPFTPVHLSEGDIAVIPHGEPHVVSSEPGMRAEPDVASHRRPDDEDDLPFKLRVGTRDDPDVRLMCGFFTCDTGPFNPLLTALPRFLRVGRGASRATDALLERFLDIASDEQSGKGAGAQTLLNRLSELLFIEAVRTHMTRLGPTEPGWLAGLNDPLIGRALARLHDEPARAWTLDDLAAECGASRSALAGRFTELVGYPPIQYLTRWRMQLAARRLKDSNEKVAVIAQEVGYDSEAAFSRAFKKHSGQSPSECRL